MAGNDIKQRIVLEGEKEYRKALQDAKRNLQTLRTELKAETAELGRNATEQQKAETKAKSLQKQIKEQEKVVRTLQAALAEAKEKYGENAEATAKWEQQLNNARAGLATMRNELEGVGQSFKQVQTDASMATVATKSVADSLGKLAGVGDAISGGIETAFQTMIGTVTSAIAQVWESVVDLAARSNNLEDLAGYWNTNVATIQAYQGAVAEASASLEDLSGLVTKINAKDSKKVAELTGVSKENYKDQWEYAMAVMDAMSRLDTEARNAAGFEMFGKGATKAFDLLNDWEKVQENLDKYSESNYGLSEEDIHQMSELYDMVNGLKMSWQYLQDKATVKLFGSLAMDLTSNAQGVLDALMAYFNAENDEERDAAVAKLEENITAAFERIGQAIQDGVALLTQLAEDLKASEDPAVQALGNVMSSLVEALKWFTEDNCSNVVTALEIIAAFWLTGKGFSMAAKIASVVKDIAVIKGFSVGGAIAGTGKGVADAAGGDHGLLYGLGATAKSLIGKAGTWLSGALPTILDVAGGLGTMGGVFGLGIAPAVMAQKQNEANWISEQEERLRIADEVAEAVGESAETAFVRAAAEALGPKKDENGNYVKDVTGNFLNMGMTDDPYELLMGLQSRQNKQKAELYNMINAYAPETEGWNTWNLLNRFWEQQDLDPYMVNSLLENITDAMTKYMENSSADWWTKQQTGGDSSGTDALMNSAVTGMNKMQGLPAQVEAAVERGASRAVGNIRVTIDGATAGRALSDYVSQDIARGISE